DYYCQSTDTSLTAYIF
nr:immunoglobulin light chain junction region [Macaca mulatta]MOX13131.1 immunoglobulin light chain junction region [Macaca mulatta]